MGASGATGTNAITMNYPAVLRPHCCPPWWADVQVSSDSPLGAKLPELG